MQTCIVFTFILSQYRLSCSTYSIAHTVIHFTFFLVNVFPYFLISLILLAIKIKKSRINIYLYMIKYLFISEALSQSRLMVKVKSRRLLLNRHVNNGPRNDRPID